MNDWTSHAARQILENAARCGITHIPKATGPGFDRAKDWLDQLAIQSGLQSAYQLGMVPTSLNPPPESSAASESQTRPESPAHPIQKTRASTNIVAESAPAIVLNLPSQWSSASLPLAQRESRFQTLRTQVDACRLCADIVCKRQKTVFGVGPTQARLVMFGEAPGADEDRSGEPFVGAAGQLMNKILEASGLKREEVYIMNSLKCRPPNNRTPAETEIENCRPFFEAQLETIQPEYIICWGAVAVRAVLQSTESVGRLRGRFHQYRGAKVMVTYHPSYLLRNPDAKRLTWDDMKMLMRELNIPIPTPPRGKS
jgi:uracil-DNA glycosylase